MRELALAGAEPHRERAVGERALETLEDSRVPEQVRGAGGHGGRVGIGKVTRRDERQVVDSHGLQRARGRADVAGMAGAGQHDADARKGLHGLHSKIDSCIPCSTRR
jgi:hypothetical protein